MVLTLKTFHEKAIQTNKNFFQAIFKKVKFPTALPSFAWSQHVRICLVLNNWTLIDVYLHPKKWDTNLFQKYLRPVNTQIKSATSLLETNTLYLFVSLISLYIQKMKVRYQSVEEILRIKEYSNLFNQEYPSNRPAPNQ